MAVDIGWAYWRKEAAKMSAQSAAIAAAVYAWSAPNFNCGNGVTCATTDTACPTAPADPPTSAINAGCLYAIKNGFTNNSRQSLTYQANISNVPVSGVTPTYWISYTATEHIPSLFSMVLGQPWISVSSRSTSGVFNTSGGCIYVLDPTAAPSMSTNGTTNVSSGCGIYVDSSNSTDALGVVGSTNITTTNNAKTNVVGGVGYCGGCTCGPSGNISPCPITGAPVAADPFAGMPVPTAGSCQPNQTIKNKATLSAGCYGDGTGTAWDLSSANANLTLNSGTYYLKGGISMGGQATLQVATGATVTIYIASGAININGGATVILNAPTSGVYQGILIWQDKSDTSADSMVGGTNQLLSGVVYLPKAALTYTGNSSGQQINTTLVSDTLTFKGTSQFKASTSTPYSGKTGAFIVE